MRIFFHIIESFYSVDSNNEKKKTIVKTILIGEGRKMKHTI